MSVSSEFDNFYALIHVGLVCGLKPVDFALAAAPLFELISRRHEKKSTLITTNKSFGEWSEVFPNAACVVALIDRLVHHAEIIPIKGKSYRHKEAQERAEAKTKKRKVARSKS